MRPSAGPSRRCLLAKMFAPAASSPFKRSAHSPPTSIRIATPSFPMGSGLPKERSSNSPPSIQRRFASCFAAFFCAACTKRNACRSVSWRIFFHGSIPFSVFAGEPLSPRDPEQLERLARYITRPPLAADSIRRHEGSIEITTRPDPRTGSTHRLFDPLDWIHAVTADIPDRGRHCVRYYGALANRAQSPKAFCEQQTPPAPDPAVSGETTS